MRRNESGTLGFQSPTEQRRRLVNVAQMRRANQVRKCLLLRVDLTQGRHHETDANDPKRTLRTLSITSTGGTLPTRGAVVPHRSASAALGSSRPAAMRKKVSALFRSLGAPRIQTPSNLLLMNSGASLCATANTARALPISFAPTKQFARATCGCIISGL